MTQPIVSLALSLLTHGNGETYALDSAALAKIEAALTGDDDGLGDRAVALRDLAWMLGAKMGSPTAGAQLKALLVRALPSLKREAVRVGEGRQAAQRARGQRFAAFQGSRPAAPAAAAAPAPGSFSARELMVGRVIR